MDHRAFIASLTASQRRHLTTKSDRQGLAHLAVHLAAIAVVASLILAAVPGWQLLMVIQGVLIVFLFTLLHETVHQTAFASQHLNLYVGYICGFAVFLAPVWFRFFHLAHHRHTQDPKNDPELAQAKPQSLRAYVLYVSGLPVWLSQLRALIRNALGRCADPFVPTARRQNIGTEARLMIAAYTLLTAACLAFKVTALIYVWLIPVLLGQPFLRLFLLAEHGRCPQVTDMFENTRTTFTTWLMRKLAWNMPYHAEHHAYPTVPFHKLPDLHALARAHLKQTEDGYARFHQKYIDNLG